MRRTVNSQSARPIRQKTFEADDTVAVEDLDKLKFVPVANWSGEATFTFKVVDSSNEESVAATVTITVNAVNDLPTAANIDDKSVDEDTTLTFALSDFEDVFSDVDGHTLKSVKIVTLPNATHGKLTDSTTDPTEDIEADDTVAVDDLDKLNFEPVANWNGKATFTFKLIDSVDGESSAAATVTITVNPVNDLPTAANIDDKSVDEDTTLTFAESDFTTAFFDLDGHMMKSVKIVTLPDEEHGVLKVGTDAVIVDVANGALNNTVAATSLGTLTFVPVANWNGTASFTFKVTDSSDSESAAAATVTITVKSVNDLPTASDFSKTVFEGTTVAFKVSDFTDVYWDLESHDLGSVKIVTLPGATQGKLTVGATGSSTDVQSGDTIAATATELGTLKFEPADNWTGVTSFTFKLIDSADGESNEATVAITVNATLNQPTAKHLFRSVDVNTTLSFAASDFNAVFEDEDDHTLQSIRIVDLPDAIHGKLLVGTAEPPADVQANQLITVSGLDTLKFKPVDDWRGTAKFTFRVIDSSGSESSDSCDSVSSESCSVSIKVGLPNELPEASGFIKSVSEDTTLTFTADDFKNVFRDGDGHTLESVKIVTLPDAEHGVLKVDTQTLSAGATVALANLGKLKFVPAANFDDSAGFTFKVIDSSGEESSVAATVMITVIAVDDLPVANDISKNVDEDTTLTFTASDFTGSLDDPDGDTLKSVKIVTLPDAAHGKLTIGTANPPAEVNAGDTVELAELGNLKFVPVMNWNGITTFTFKVTDSTDSESAIAATVAITVNAVNDPPTASDFARSVDEDTTLTFALTDFEDDVVFSDVDEDDTLKSVKIVTLPDPTHGVLKVDTAAVIVDETNPNRNNTVAAADLGTLKFEPVANWHGTASFKFKLIDSADGESNEAEVTITVRSIEDNPIAMDFSVEVDEDTTLTFAQSDFEGAFSDPDGHTLKSVKIVTLPVVTHGVLKLVTQTSTQTVSAGDTVALANLDTPNFEPVGNFNDEASFTFKVTDSTDRESAAAATATIKVNAVNDLPSVESNISKTVNEDTTLTFVKSDFDDVFSDIDEDDTLKSVKIVTLPDEDHGVLKLVTQTSTQTVSAGDTVLSANLGTLKFEPVANWHGTASFKFKLIDSADGESNEAEVTITVGSVDDNPIAMNFTKSVIEDTTLTFAKSDFEGAFSDPDGHMLKSVKIVTLPDATHGKLTLDTTDPPTEVQAGDTVTSANLDKLKFVPVANYTGEATFTFKVTDTSDSESAAEATVTITVREVDDLPTASDFAKSVNEDTTLTFVSGDFTGAFNDVDGHTLKSVKIVTLPDATHGKLTLDTTDPPTAVPAGGSVALANLDKLKFVPVANWHGTETFTFKVTDSSDSDSAAAATVTITVNSVNDLPTAADIFRGVDLDTTLAISADDFSNEFSDGDRDTLKSVKIVTLPVATHGVLKVGTDAVIVDVNEGTLNNTVAVADLGTLTFEPATGFIGTARFTFKVINSSDEESSSSYNFDIGVGLSPQPPTAEDFSKSVNNDAILKFTKRDFTNVFNDVNRHTLQSVKIVTLPDATHGVLKVGNDAVIVDVNNGTLNNTVAEAFLGTLTFEPVATHHGEASFTFKVTDSSDAESVEANTVTIMVTARPTAGNFSKSVNEDTTMTFTQSDFSGAFSDMDNHPLKSVKIVTLPDATHGVLKVDTAAVIVDETNPNRNNTVAAADLRTLTFEPVANWNGKATFTFKVTDSSDSESAAAATVTITVASVNDAPTAGNISKSVNNNETLTFAQSDFTNVFNDVDDDDSLKSVRIVTLPKATEGVLKVGTDAVIVDVANGTLNNTVALASLNTLAFEPIPTFTGDASFTFKVTDSSDSESSAAATVMITVTALPTASNFTKSASENTTLTFAQSDFTDAFSDEDNHTLKSVRIVTLPKATDGVLKVGTQVATAGQSVDANDLGTLTFEPAANFTGNATFTFKVTDSSDSESSAVATVTISVRSTALPTAGNFSKSENEDTTVTFAASDFSGVFSDLDGHTLKSVKIVTLPNATHGVLKAKVGSESSVSDVEAGDTVVLANLGTLTFEPVANWNGNASFTFKVIDSSDSESAAAATVTITVNAVDDHADGIGLHQEREQEHDADVCPKRFHGCFQRSGRSHAEVGEDCHAAESDGRCAEGWYYCGER